VLLGSSWELLGSARVLLGPGHEKEAKGASGKTSKYVTYKGSNAFSKNTVTAFADWNLGFGRGSGEANCHRSRHSFLRLERASKATRGGYPQGAGHKGSQGSALGGSLEALGGSLEAPGNSLGAPGELLGAPWELLRSS
jgi:hypothetical protein